MGRNKNFTTVTIKKKNSSSTKPFEILQQKNSDRQRNSRRTPGQTVNLHPNSKESQRKLSYNPTWDKYLYH
jgi:hypothetical protein